jgi:phosphoglycerol transferase MdoB-like AlkP superfamily enzyme
MAFYGLLVIVNVACFVSLFALNFRDSPNPFEFLLPSDKSAGQPLLKLLYARIEFTDPFRINFDFTFATLLVAAFGYRYSWLTFLLAGVLAFGFVEILYTAAMQAVFKRAPALASDLSLLKAGVKLAQRQAYWMVPAAVLVCAGIALVAFLGTRWLFRLMPDDFWLPLAIAALLLPPCFYRWRSYGYPYFLARAVYSPLLHFWRNLSYGRRLDALFTKDAAHFERRNRYSALTFRNPPNVVLICVESYGSLVYRKDGVGGSIDAVVAEYERRLADSGYRFASVYSAAPIFAGGSWASYASLTYGIEFSDLQLFDGLFAHDSTFASYESLFHVLRRNGYRNYLLCPLGGVDTRSVDWSAIQRCFQSDQNIDFASLNYRGPLVNYLGLVRRYSPLDQYSLNYGYDLAIRDGRRPVSLFFCTLNSHFPWDGVGELVADWRTLDDPRVTVAACRGSALERYELSIRYQLDYALRFALDRAADDLVIVLFGDHQPPFLTPERMGKDTPLHVLARNPAFIEVFREHGFVSRLGLRGTNPEPMRHQGFLSLFMKAMSAAYGNNPHLHVDYVEHGVALFDEPEDGAGHPPQAAA